MARNFSQKADRRFLIYLFIWVVFGLVALSSASAPVGWERFNDNYYFVKSQILYGIIPGLVLFLVLARLSYRTWEKFAWPAYGLSILLLLLVFVPGVGMVINGSKSWIGLFGHSFQPSEFAKLAVVLIAAKLFSDPDRNLSNWKKGLVPSLAILSPLVLLILAQPDLGTLMILVVIIYSMLYLAKLPRVYLIILGLSAAIAFAVAMMLMPSRMQRLTVFLHPELDPKGIGYHVNQSLLAIGSGGFSGLGYGHSRQKYQYLPEVSADSVYAVIAEEMGFIFAAGLVVLILLLGLRGLKIAKVAPDDFGRLLVGGIMVWVIWQSFVNISAMVGILPLTGVPLPFVSHGGSAMIMLLSAMGIVANVSRNISQPL